MTNSLKDKTYRFLIWAQKYTRTDNIYLFKGGFWLILWQAVSMASSFLLAVAFANLLDPATYGTYNYILSLAETLAIFSIGGINVAVTQAVARGLEGSFYSGFKTKLKWGILGSLGLMGLAIYYFIKGNETLTIPLLIAAILLPLRKASYIYGNFLMGRKLFNIGTQYSIIIRVVFVAVIISTLFLTKNLFWLIAAYFIFDTFLNYSFYLLTKFKFQPNKKEDSQTIPFGKHLSLSGVIGRGTKELDKVLLFPFFGPVEVAIYSFAILIPNQINAILGNLHILALPKLTTKSREEIKTNLTKKAAKLFILTAIIVAVYIIAAPFIYRTLFPQYLASVFYSQLCMLALLFFPIHFLGGVFEAKMMKKEIYLMRLMGIVRLILMAILIPAYGLWGAVLAWLGSQAFNGIFILFLYRFSFKN